MYTDPLDGLNKKLSPIDTRYYRKMFLRIAMDQCGESPGIDFDKHQYIIQVSGSVGLSVQLSEPQHISVCAFHRWPDLIHPKAFPM